MLPCRAPRCRCRCDSPCDDYYDPELPEAEEDLDEDVPRSDVEGDGPWLDYVLASSISTTAVVLAVALTVWP